MCQSILGVSRSMPIFGGNSGEMKNHSVASEEKSMHSARMVAAVGVPALDFGTCYIDLGTAVRLDIVVRNSERCLVPRHFSSPRAA